MYVSNRGVSKYTPHFYKGISRWFYAIKFNSFTFSADSSKHLCVKKYISLLFLPIYRLFAHLRRNFFLNTSSLIQRNKIKDLSEYAFNFLHFSYKRTKNPLTFTKEFRGTLTTKISHLLQIVYKLRKNASHFLCRFESTLSKHFFTFITDKEKSPSLYKGLQKHFDHLKIVLFTNCLHSNPHTIERR